MTEPSIEIRKLRNVNLKGGIVLDGFPSTCLTSAIASECLVHTLKTEHVAFIDSPAFPPLSIIRNSQPNFPARVYANEDLKIAMFVSELNLDPVMFRPVANTILDWALASNGDLVVSAAGLPYDGNGHEDNDPKMYAVASTPHALKKAADAGIPPITNGSVVGIPAILLNEGAWRNYDVIVLLVKVLREAPDFRAGAAVAEAISRLAPGASCDVSALLKEAEVMEKTLKKIRNEQGELKKEQMYG